MEDKKIKIVTHSGSFHPDEVFATATLSLTLKEPFEIIRTKDLDIIKTGDYVVDAGWIYDPENNRFDHHQEGGAGKRENGIPYSSFGLVWKKFGAGVCGGSQEAADIIDRRLVSSIDAADNRIDSFTAKSKELFPYIIHDISLAFRPTWKETKNDTRSYKVAFGEFLDIVKKILEREISSAIDEVEGLSIVRDVYNKTEDKRVILLDEQYPWESALVELKEPLYVVQPDKQKVGQWQVTAVRENRQTFSDRKSFPEKWAGKRADELIKITGVSDAIYCHNDRFIVIAGSKEGALALTKLSLED